ncbi:hypothetical protein GLAREA_03262 [Glarea lozoyensis ATCC 20868]|uniref:F-box domain-containing protein n=1 Tax=Glarea lozoyensis (strain ATCC 20868 / MF5171) TaxID=1116229 RepID=S3CLJ4_GLAL2|nr:uncharacterized protein GLAREA_03262 [Glarea lozoyensis ATCC 20868]EPE27347.1 hypothetical protein GLAREA_03262 [Glarea lozoyensis ATCC 20868]
MASTSNIIPSPAETCHIRDLPNELLCHIFDYLDASKPSDFGLDDEPTFAVTDSNTANLKSISQVTKAWRSLVIPTLFRHARLVVSDPETKRPLLNDHIAPFLAFATRNSLRKYITSFVLLVRDKKIAHLTNGEYRLSGFASVWDTIFKVIDPSELLVVAHPASLGPLAACNVYLSDAWNFDCPCHYLRLRRPAMPVGSPAAKAANFVNDQADFGREDLDQMMDDLTVDKASPNAAGLEISLAAGDANVQEHDAEPWELTRAKSSPLFDIRPWTSFLLNEGSFIRAYATYEFWLRQAPSILSDLVGAEQAEHKSFISPTISDMSYIGIFPMERHFRSLTDNLPRLDKLFVQLVPRNDILNQASKMVQVEAEDLWMERNSCYASVVRQLFNSPSRGNYKHLQVFESGDAADRDAWLMAVEYIKRAGKGWEIASEGVFVREGTKYVDGENEEASELDNTAFQRSLIRWSWAGTRRLPVSAFTMYEQPFGPII